MFILSGNGGNRKTIKTLHVVLSSLHFYFVMLFRQTRGSTHIGDSLHRSGALIAAPSLDLEKSKFSMRRTFIGLKGEPMTALLLIPIG